MMSECLLFTPAYACLSAEDRRRAQESVAALCAARRWQPRWAPSTKREHPPGTWLSIHEREQEMAVGWEMAHWWPLRGGFGAQHLLPWLLAQDSARAPQLLGYSDITVWHGLWQRRGWGPSLYASMPALGLGPRSSSSLHTLLNGETLHLDAAQDPGLQVLAPGRASGPCFAGCLSVLAACCGTPAFPKLDGHLLFIEDIDERPYRVDRCLWQLYLSGGLGGLRGLVAGIFPETEPLARGPKLSTILGQWAERLGVPCLYGLPFGHHPDPWSIPCGGQAELACDKSSWQIDLSLARA